MPLRIPERNRPLRVTIGDAFAYLVKRTIKPDSDIGRAGDLAAAVHFAGLRVFQRSTMTAAQAQSSLLTVDFLDTDPIDIVSALWDGIASSKLSVEGLPENLREKWIAGPVVHDWTTGLYLVSIDGQQRQIFPTLDPREVDALFAIGRKDEDAPSSPAEAGRISPAALAAFLAEIMASERLTEAQAIERAKDRFALRSIPDALWRPAWKKAPNKRGRGEKLSGKSGA